MASTTAESPAGPQVVKRRVGRPSNAEKLVNEPAETRLQSWERQIAARGPLALIGWKFQQLFVDYLHSKTRGRPVHADITKAVQMEAQGSSRSQIYAALGKTSRDEQHALVEAMRQRKFRERRATAERDKSAASL